MEDKFVSFSGKLRVLAETEEMTTRVEVMLLNDEVTLNNWQYLNLEEHMASFADKPILVAYKGKQIGDGHNFEEIRNPDGTITASFMAATAERIVGWFRSVEDLRIEIIDNKKWIVGRGYIWTWYAQELVAKIKEQGLDGMSVSIETLITEMHMDGDTEVYTKYIILGTTILGDSVNPAVEDASIRALSAIGSEEIRKMTLRVASQNSKQPTGEPDEPQDPDATGTKRNQGQKTNKKGENRMKLKDLEPLFPGYKLLAMNGETVAMLSENGDPYLCSFTVENGQTILGAKVALDSIESMTVDFKNGDTVVPVSLGVIVGRLNAQIEELTTAKNEAESARDTLTKTVDAMQKAETLRRENAVRAAIKEHLEEIRSNTQANIPADCCKDLLTDAAVACYAAMEQNGVFCGDEAARKDVDSICMKAVLEANKAQVKANANRYAWDSPIDGKDEKPVGIDAAIARMMQNS